MKKGFTLIELIVTVAIITTVTGLTLANYIITSQSQILNASKTEILEYIRLARQQSETSQVYTGCSIDSLLGYGLAVDTGTNTVSLTYFCPTAPASPLRTLAVGTRYFGMEVTNLSSNGTSIPSFYFTRLAGVTNTGNDVTLCLQHTVLLKYVKLIIRVSGKIETYDNQTACP